MNNVKDRKQLLIRRLILLLVDSISVIVAFYGALALYFNGPIESRFIQGSLPLAMILLVISLGLFAVLKLYTSLWQFASVSELMNIVIATAMSTVVNVIICEAFGFSPPESTYFYLFYGCDNDCWWNTFWISFLKTLCKSTSFVWEN